MHRHTVADPVSGSFPRTLLVSVDLRSGRVRMAGELDRGSVPAVLDALAALRPTGSPVWTLDAARVTFCDAGGLRALARARDLAVGSGRRLHVARPTPFLARLLALVGLDELLEPPPPVGGHLRVVPAPAADPGEPAAGPGQLLRCRTKS